jgi:hypothetical protein
MGPRVLNAVVGLWLFFSTFLVAKTPPQRWIGWVVGALAVVGALLGRSGGKRGRYLNAALGGWLILFAILLPRAHAATFWNDLLVGFAMVLLALVTNTGDLRRRKPAEV